MQINDPALAPLPQLMSTREVAAVFGRTTRTIRNWVRDGDLRPVRVGGAVFFNRLEVERLASGGSGTSAQATI